VKDGCIVESSVGMAEGNNVGEMAAVAMYVIFPWLQITRK